MPSGTLESPHSISRARALARTSTLHQGAEKSGFGNGYVQTCVFIFCPVHANVATHDRLEIVVAPPIS